MIAFVVVVVVAILAPTLPNVGAVFDWPNAGVENAPKLGGDCVVVGVPKIDCFCSVGLFAPNVNALDGGANGFGFGLVAFDVPNGKAGAAFFKFGDAKVDE